MALALLWHWPGQSILGPRHWRDRLQVAAIAVEAANLIRRREEVATALVREVIDQVLQHEQLGRRLELLDSQLATQRHRHHADGSAVGGRFGGL